MEKIDDFKILNVPETIEIKNLLKKFSSKNAEELTHFFNQKILDELNWKIFKIDDNQILDNDLKNLLHAFHSLKINKFFVTPLSEIDNKSTVIKVYEFQATPEDLIKLQTDIDWQIKLTFQECLIFSLPLKFAILRPGYVGTMIYAGSSDFIKLIQQKKI